MSDSTLRVQWGAKPYVLKCRHALFVYFGPDQKIGDTGTHLPGIYRLVAAAGVYSYTSGAASLSYSQFIPGFDFYISPTANPLNDPADASGTTPWNPSGTGTNTGKDQAHAWSIQALANKACRALYTGKRVGLMDGVYAINGMFSKIPASTTTIALFNCEGGTAASPTVITAINPRKAIIDAHQVPGQFGTGWSTAAMSIIGNIGNQNQNQPSPINNRGNIQFIGLVITGGGCPLPPDANTDTGGSAGIHCMGLNPGGTLPTASTPGVVVQDCEIYDFMNSHQRNIGLVTVWYQLGPVVRNCLLHDYRNAANLAGDGIITEPCQNGIYEYNTVYNIFQGIYEKNAWQAGQTVRYNMVGPCYQNALADFTGAKDGSAFPTGYTTNIYNNILFVTSGNFIFDGLGLSTHIGPTNSINFYNNTYYSTNGAAGFYCTPQGSLASPPALLNQYNNIYVSSTAMNVGPGHYGWQTVSTGGVNVLDYNMYSCLNNDPANLMFSTLPTGSDQYLGTYTYYSRAGWLALGFDAHSSFHFSTDAGYRPSDFFVDLSQPQNAAGYKLTAGHPGKTFGRVGGVSTGAVCEAGAWGGPSPPTRVGCDFLPYASTANDPFPRTYLSAIAPAGGSGSTYAYASPTFQSQAANFNIICCGPYMGIEQDMGHTTFATIFSNIKSQSTTNGLARPTCCLHYTMSSEQSLPGGTGDAGTYTVWTNTINATNWWIRNGYPGGAIVTFDPNSGIFATTSQNTITDAGGRTFAQSYWNHYDGVLRNGNAVALGYASGIAFAANPYCDGYEMDNVFCLSRSSNCSWGMTSTVYPAGDATAAAWLQQGQAQQIAAARSASSGLTILCNSDFFVHSTSTFSSLAALDPSIKYTMDIIFCEAVLGASYSIEGQTTTGNTQAVMNNLIAAEQLMASHGTLVVAQLGRSRTAGFTSANQSSWTSADWQAARFGLAMTCMRNWHYAVNAGTYNSNAILLMDEFLAQQSVVGWLGRSTSADPPQTGPRTSGVWYRNFPPSTGFPGGVVFMNPYLNGTQTIDLTALGLTGLSAISSNGYGDTSINTGNPVTSITLQDRDGRFLIYS